MCFLGSFCQMKHEGIDGQASLPPCVVIHGRSDLATALAPGLPVTLISAPGAAGYAGCGWWRALIALSPIAGVPHILDCADASGRALEAMQVGLPRLILCPGASGFAQVQATARLYDTQLLTERPPALDLAERGATRRLAAWLADAHP